MNKVINQAEICLLLEKTLCPQKLWDLGTEAKCGNTIQNYVKGNLYVEIGRKNDTPIVQYTGEQNDWNIFDMYFYTTL